MKIQPTSTPQCKKKPTGAVPAKQVSSNSVDSFVEATWDGVHKARSYVPGVVMAPVMGIYAAVPYAGLKLARAHRELDAKGPEAGSLAKLGTLTTYLSQVAGLTALTATAGSYLFGVGDPGMLGKISLGCFAVGGAGGVATSLGTDWQ